jgi:aprataxin and PNK-like factor
LNLDSKKPLPVCPYGATCFRKNLIHFAEFSHPFDLLNPDADSSDDEEKDSKKRKAVDENEKAKEEEDDADKTEEYDSDDVSL